MQLKQFHQGGCLVHAFATDLALFALAFRHAASNEHLQRLTPLMPTMLESLAATFEGAILLSLQQTGYLDVAGNETLTAEQVQALCQQVVVEGVEKRVKVGYETDEAQ